MPRTERWTPIGQRKQLRESNLAIGFPIDPPVVQVLGGRPTHELHGNDDASRKSPRVALSRWTD